MADQKIPRARKVPPPKTEYIAPHEEVWSDDTQAAVDRYLHGVADHDRRGGEH